MRQKKVLQKTIFLIVVCLSFFSCASNRYEHFAKAMEMTATGNYEGAYDLINKNEAVIYEGEKDDVLYELDTGMLLHYAKRYQESNESLIWAEKVIEENLTKSVTRTIASGIQGDDLQTYFGEDYENIYLNLFTSLNYVNLKDFDNAFVELRRADEKIKVLYQKNQIDIERSKQELADNKLPPPDESILKNALYDSALFRYLHILFTKAEKTGDYKSNIRIDYDNMVKIFNDQKNMYYFPLPKFVTELEEVKELLAERSGSKEKTAVNQDESWLYFLVFSGQSPYKEDNSQYINLPHLNVNTKIALPKLTTVTSKVSFVEISGNGINSIKLEMIEDLSQVAAETFKIKYQYLYNRAMIRSTVKAAMQAAGTAAQQVNQSAQASGSASTATAVASLIGSIINLAAKTSSLTEKPDLRIAQFFPGQAYIGGLRLKPGTYDFTVSYYNSSGGKIYETQHNYEVKSKGLNLINTQWLN